MGYKFPQGSGTWYTFDQSRTKRCRLLMVGEPTLVTVKGGQRSAIQATSKVPINCNVVSLETEKGIGLILQSGNRAKWKPQER